MLFQRSTLATPKTRPPWLGCLSTCMLLRIYMQMDPEKRPCSPSQQVLHLPCLPANIASPAVTILHSSSPYQALSAFFFLLLVDSFPSLPPAPVSSFLHAASSKLFCLVLGRCNSTPFCCQIGATLVELLETLWSPLSFQLMQAQGQASSGDDSFRALSASSCIDVFRECRITK